MEYPHTHTHTHTLTNAYVCVDVCLHVIKIKFKVHAQREEGEMKERNYCFKNCHHTHGTHHYSGLET